MTKMNRASREEPPSPTCERALRALVEALGNPSSALNARFNYTQRMRVTGVEASPIRPDGPRRCAVTLTIGIAEVSLTYTLAVDLRAREVILRDDADLEERIRLGTGGSQVQPVTIRALYDALAVDIAAHFGADA
jgi:hypothetical protein